MHLNHNLPSIISLYRQRTYIGNKLGMMIVRKLSITRMAHRNAESQWSLKFRYSAIVCQNRFSKNTRFHNNFNKLTESSSSESAWVGLEITLHLYKILTNYEWVTFVRNYDWWFLAMISDIYKEAMCQWADLKFAFLFFFCHIIHSNADLRLMFELLRLILNNLDNQLMSICYHWAVWNLNTKTIKNNGYKYWCSKLILNSFDLLIE